MNAKILLISNITRKYEIFLPNKYTNKENYLDVLLLPFKKNIVIIQLIRY